MKWLISLCLLLCILTSCKTASETDFVLQLIQKNEHLLAEDTKQLVVVYNNEQNSHKATLVILSKTDSGWQLVSELIPAGIGSNGFANPDDKKEGDGMSPSGLFKLGHLFTYEKEVGTKMPFTQSTAEDKWIDDPSSLDYNQHVRGETTAKSFENLLLKSDSYKYCMVIEYNTNPVIKGKGSAIFFHLNKTEYASTAGCVAVLEKEMLKVLEWMNPELNPMILMGNRELLLDDLRK